MGDFVKPNLSRDGGNVRKGRKERRDGKRWHKLQRWKLLWVISLLHVGKSICSVRVPDERGPIVSFDVSLKAATVGKRSGGTKGRVTLYSGTNLHEPACSAAQQQAIKNR